MSTWHEVRIIRYGETVGDLYEEMQVVHDHPEPAEECELTLYLERVECALDYLQPGSYLVRMIDGETEVVTVSVGDVDIIDVVEL